MGAHLIDGEFQSDKYPTTPRGKVPLSVKDKSAQDLLWEYAQRRRAVDPEFSEDLETALIGRGFSVARALDSRVTGRTTLRHFLRLQCWVIAGALAVAFFPVGIVAVAVLELIAVRSEVKLRREWKERTRHAAKDEGGIWIGDTKIDTPRDIDSLVIKDDGVWVNGRLVSSLPKDAQK